MPYSRDHLLLRFGGPAAEDQETWSCGVRLVTTEPQTGDGLLEAAEDAVDSITAFTSSYVQSIGAKFSSVCELSYVKLNPIAASTGDYLFPNSPVERLLSEPYPNGDASVPSPLQVAYCVTMRGEFRRGPAARGRFYVPVGDLQVTGTGVMPAATAQQYADAAGTFLENIQFLNSDVGKSLRLRLMGDGVGGPRDSEVRSVSVGNVYDTQRRRRRSVAETYYESATWVEP